MRIIINTVRIIMRMYIVCTIWHNKRTQYNTHNNKLLNMYYNAY